MMEKYVHFTFFLNNIKIAGISSEDSAAIVWICQERKYVYGSHAKYCCTTDHVATVKRGYSFRRFHTHNTIRRSHSSDLIDCMYMIDAYV